jgi:dTMP kinase
MPDKKLTEGLTIMFDGPDGVGKTTQVRLAHESLEQQGYTVYTTRSHGGTPIGEALREVSLSPLGRPVVTDLYISLAIHGALASDLAEKRHQGFITLVDRSPLSIIAYQVYGDGFDKARGFELVESDMETLQPDMLIVYHAEREIAKDRLRGRARNSDFFEDKPDEYFERVAEGYRVAAERYHAQAIDAATDTPTVHAKTMQYIDALLPHKAIRS